MFTTLRVEGAEISQLKLDLSAAELVIQGDCRLITGKSRLSSKGGLRRNRSRVQPLLMLTLKLTLSIFPVEIREELPEYLPESNLLTCLKQFFTAAVTRLGSKLSIVKLYLKPSD
jgi:hypothetical protein